MTPRDFQAGSAVRALNPDVPEIGGHAPQPAVIVASAAVEDEGDLREQIRKEIVRRRWCVFCGTTAARSRRTVGEPDLLVFADRGRVFPVELKSRTGKLSPAQNAVHHHLRSLGHTPHVIRSLEEFLEVVK